MKNCSQCDALLPADARFCSQCGSPQEVPLTQSEKVAFNWEEALVPQAFVRFKQRLEERVKAEQDPSRVHAYQERLYEDNYRETIDRRLKQWADELADDQATEISKLRRLIDDLLDVFFILHTADLNVVVLPEAILGYHGRSLEQIDLAAMGRHFLHFEDAEERVYIDFLRMPVKKIRNLSKTFLFPEREEKIWFVCDQSLLGSAKEGFAMTDQALYWKSGFQPAQRVYYHKLFGLQKEKEWLLINELYFNAGQTLNTRMIWLLRCLSRLFRAEL